MKWSSATSTDRKSVFYTSEDSAKFMAVKKEGTSVTDNVFSFKMGGDDGTTESQNSKSSSSIESNSKTHNNNNGTDLKRYLKNFMLFSNLEIESEKKCRDEQLSKIVKALLYFEKKLRKEQEIIQQQLCEKDKVINRQMHTISDMKVRLGVQCDDLDDSLRQHETAEYCPMCRKKYYFRATKSMATQTLNSGNKFPNISDDYSSIQSIEYMSSSEEQEALLSPNPFSTARRSKKYTSKKSYKDYLQQRPHHNSENNKSKSSSIAVASASTSIDMPSDFPNNSDNNNNKIHREDLNGKEIGISKSSKCGGAAKFSLIMNDIHGVRQQKPPSHDDTHSLKINRMHGISQSAANERKETNDDDTKTVENGNQSTINAMVEIKEQQHEAADARKYCDDGLEVKQKIATRDDWYISDIEETETLGGKPAYSNVIGVSNSVLECVNQILLQQSMDEFVETQIEKRSSFASTESRDSQSSLPPPTRSNKRVHFSTKNSMVQITPLPRAPPSDLHSDDMLNSTYENQSNYSNEYEPIGSSRTYVDMDTKSLDNYKPTLPPKPDNLMKLQQISKQRQFVQDQIYKHKNSDYDINESEEPDYCSISEIQDNIKSVKIVTAEIHSHAEDDDNEYSEIKEVPTPSPSTIGGDDSFEDVPKLPNVYSIIPGFEPPPPPTTPRSRETPTKCIGLDNYITKSPKKILSPTSILAEINNVKKLTPPKVAPPPIPMKNQQQQQHHTIKILDEKIQQEFDWYNLDAEYTKSDVIATQIENIEEMYQFDDENDVMMNGDESDTKIEYNLDLEFEQHPSPEAIEIETNNNNFTTVIKINESSSSCGGELSSPVSKTTSKTTNLIELAETPKLDLKKKLNYEKFLSESGMLSKPLMARKKFYAGSFV